MKKATQKRDYPRETAKIFQVVDAIPEKYSREFVKMLATFADGVALGLRLAEEQETKSSAK